MIKAVIFDLDGVLRDAEWVNLEAAKKSFSELGIRIDKNDEDIIIGRHPVDYVPLLQKRYNIDYEGYCKVKRKNYFEMLKQARLFPHAKEVLGLLKKNHLKLGLATSSERGGVYDYFIRPYGLDNIFDAVVTTEDCSKRKPNPEVYLTAARKLGADPGECLVVEDTAIGVEAAKNAGSKCVAIPNELTKGYDFSKADAVLKSLKDLNMALIRRFGE